MHAYRSIFVGTLAITLGCGSEKSSSTSQQAKPSEPVRAAPKQPSLETTPDPAGQPAPSLATSTPPAAAVAFETQTRDVEWAPSTEVEIRRRFDKVRGAKLEDTECRQSQCRLVIAGSEVDVGQTIADLESDRGLHGYANNILLTAPEKKPDGTLVLRAFATFER